MVVPEKLKHRMEIAHEGYQGQVRTKQLLRAHVYIVLRNGFAMRQVRIHVHRLLGLYIICSATFEQLFRFGAILILVLRVSFRISRNFFLFWNNFLAFLRQFVTKSRPFKFQFKASVAFMHDFV